MCHTQRIRASLSLVLCMGCLIGSLAAQSNIPSPQGGLRVQQLGLSKVLDQTLHLVEIDVVVSLQTSGMTVSKLTLFYRTVGTPSFAEAPCRPSPDLSYHARLLYADAVEYYFVAIPLVGSPIRFGDGRITGSDVKPSKQSKSPFSPALAAGTSGLAAFLASLLIVGDEPTFMGATQKKNPYTDLYVAVGTGAALGAITYLILRHKRSRKAYAPRGSPPRPGEMAPQSD
jgi:hypothetical protein